MTTADDELTAPRARCGPHLARLAVLAGSPPGTPLPTGTAAEVSEAAGEVLAQAEQAVSAAAARQQAAGEFLTARLARLRAAAGDAVTAARSGDAAALRACLRQFDALTSALWTVHEAVTVPAPRPPRPDRRAAPGREARGENQRRAATPPRASAHEPSRNAASRLYRAASRESDTPGT